MSEQQVPLAAYCQGRGYTVLEQIADEGIGGRLEERPGLQPWYAS